MIKSALPAALLCCLLGSLVCEDEKKLTVHRGENATLQCHGPRNATVVLLRWSRPDLKLQGHVFVFRKGLCEDQQHPDFKDRVYLQDPGMKNGNFSVILRNVTMNDTGLYECFVGYGNPEDTKKPVSSINLRVEDPGQQGGQRGDGAKGDRTKGDGTKGDGTKGDGGEGRSFILVVVGVLVAVLVLGIVAAFGFAIYTRCRDQQNQNYEATDQDESEL